MRRHCGTVLIAPLCLALLACVPQKASDLQGRYAAPMGSVSIELLLKEDRQYEQLLAAPNASVKVISRGTWNYYPEQSRIDFTNLRTVVAESCSSVHGCQLGGPENASLPVERNFLIGTIRIGAEEGNPYVRRQ